MASRQPARQELCCLFKIKYHPPAADGCFTSTHAGRYSNHAVAQPASTERGYASCMNLDTDPDLHTVITGSRISSLLIH